LPELLKNPTRNYIKNLIKDSSKKRKLLIELPDCSCCAQSGAKYFFADDTILILMLWQSEGKIKWLILNSLKFYSKVLRRGISGGKRIL